LSFISPYALLFFGKTCQSTKKTNENSFEIDDWIQMNLDKQTNELIRELKEKFHYLLEEKALRKNLYLQYENDLIETIIHLITKKDPKLFLIDEIDPKTKLVSQEWDDET